MKTLYFVTQHIKNIECSPKPSAADPSMQPVTIWAMELTTNYLGSQLTSPD